MNQKHNMNLADKFLIAMMLILFLQSAYTLFVNPPMSQVKNTVDIVIRTSAAGIFGYFISSNFMKKGESASAASQSTPSGTEPVPVPQGDTEQAAQAKDPIGFIPPSVPDGGAGPDNAGAGNPNPIPVNIPGGQPSPTFPASQRIKQEATPSALASQPSIQQPQGAGKGVETTSVTVAQPGPPDFVPAPPETDATSGSSSKFQIMIVSGISISSLLLLLFLRNFWDIPDSAAPIISQLRDFVSAGIGFLISRIRGS